MNFILRDAVVALTAVCALSPLAPMSAEAMSNPVPGRSYEQGRVEACYYPSNGRSTKFDCHIQVRTNSNGHTVWDETAIGEGTHTFVLWDNGFAEMFEDGVRYTGRWSEHNNWVKFVADNGYTVEF